MNIYRQARIKAGFRSRLEAAEKIFIGEKTLARIEAGKRTPTPDEVAVLAKAYGREVACRYCSSCPVKNYIQVAE